MRATLEAGGKEARAQLPLLLACSFAASFAQSMMNIALPQVADEFGVTLSTANWLVTGYMVVAATSIALAAFLLRRLGLRTVFFIGCGALALGSGLALFAPNFWVLLAGRLVQAVCTGLFYSAVTSFIMANSDPARRGTHLALNSGTVAAGLAVSPVVSGLVLTGFGRHALFALPLALAVLLLAVGFFRLREVGPRGTGAVDPLSVVLGLGALVYGLGEVFRDPLPSLAVLAAGVAVLGLFAWRQLVLKDPLLNLRLLGNLGFAVGELLVMLGMMASFSLSILLPLYYEGALGFSAFLAGALLAGPVLANALSDVVGGRLLDRWGIWPLVPCGFALTALGLAVVALAAGRPLLALVVLASAVAYVGLGLVVALEDHRAKPASAEPVRARLVHQLGVHPDSLGHRLVAVRGRAVRRRARGHVARPGEGGRLRCRLRAHDGDSHRDRCGEPARVAGLRVPPAAPEGLTRQAVRVEAYGTEHVGRLRRVGSAAAHGDGLGGRGRPRGAAGTYPSMASMALITAPRNASFSSDATPLMVVPPGEHTASFMAPGCVPVSRCSFAVPIIIWAARR